MAFSAEEIEQERLQEIYDKFYATQPLRLNKKPKITTQHNYDDDPADWNFGEHAYGEYQHKADQFDISISAAEDIDDMEIDAE